MKINNIKMMDTGIRVFTTHCGFVETDTGRVLKYFSEYNQADNQYKNLEEYYDQIRYDFENEVANDPDNVGEGCLFNEPSEEEIKEFYRLCEDF
jgi:ABC-type sulfate transport system substrate-binding protein